MRTRSATPGEGATVDRSPRWRRVLPTAAVIGAAALTGSAGAPFLGQRAATAMGPGLGPATVTGAPAPDRPHSDRYTDKGDGTWMGAWGVAGDPGWHGTRHRDGAESKKRTDKKEEYTTVPCDSDALIAAITAANAAGGGRLSLAEKCRYTLTINLDGNGLPEILAPIKIRGNGATIVRAANAEAFRIVTVGIEGDLELRDLRIKGGQSEGDGGGIFVEAGGRLRLDHVTMADNISTGDDGDGGGIANEGQSTIVHSTITQNISANDGGGVHNDGNGSVTIKKSVIAKNQAGDTGGGVENDGAAIKIAYSVVHGNNAVDDGGGVYTCAGVTTISRTVVSDNHAGDTSGGVGHEVGVSGHMTDVTIRRNTAGTTGGGIAVEGDGSTVTVADSKIVENNAVAGAGGGVWIEDDDSGNEVTIRRTTISRNQATSAGATGGGIYNGTNTTMALNNTRVIDNLANTAPGGIDNRGTITVAGKVVIVGNRPTNCAGSPNPVPTCAG